METPTTAALVLMVQDLIRAGTDKETAIREVAADFDLFADQVFEIRDTLAAKKKPRRR